MRLIIRGKINCNAHMTCGDVCILRLEHRLGLDDSFRKHWCPYHGTREWYETTYQKYRGET